MTFSLNAVAIEKTWYCIPEKSGGLSFDNKAWEIAQFNIDRASDPDRRMMVKQLNNKLSFPKDSFYGRHSLECKKTTYLEKGGLACSNAQGTVGFNLQTDVGYAVSYLSFGWLGESKVVNKPDSLIVTAWRCETF